MELLDYEKALRSGSTVSQPVTGLCGRIIRGIKPEDFTTLTDDPTRKLVLLVGPDGLQKMLGKTPYELLVSIGYPADYIVRKVSEKNQFKLVVFKEGGAAKLANWDNTIEVVAEVYPDVADDLRKALPELKARTFVEQEAQAGFIMAEVDTTGSSDPRYMTYDRYKASRRTVADARSFLYFTVHLRELYSGDGYTYNEAGGRELMEYIVANKPLAELGDQVLIDLDVQISNTQQTGVVTMTQKRLPVPAFFTPDKVKEVYRVEYEQRAVDATAYAKANGIKPAATDHTRICLMPIDVQNTFCQPDFELFVGGRSGTGAIDDNVRLCDFIYDNLDRITEIAPTMDTHTAMQIFHPVFWVDENGQHPIGAQTIIELVDVENGVWKVNPAIAKSVAGGNYVGLQRHAIHYVKKLTDGGKFPLMVWPYHAMLGGIGHALVSAVEEAAFFHNLVRNAQTGFEIKGGNPLTENYSVLRPEVLEGADGRPVAQKNTRFIKKLLDFDAIIIGGQAKSHCVAWTIADLLDEINTQDPELAKKVYLLEDCTSAVVVPGVVDFTDPADEAFQRFADAGMNVVKSTDPLETWPGLTLR